MHRTAIRISAAILAIGAAAGPALADPVPVQPIAGTRLELSADGQVSRTPDIARIGAGVVTQAPSAAAAMAQNAERMARVLAAVRGAGIAERDIRTASLSLQPQYVYQEGQPPRITGYQASNQLSLTLRDLRRAGPVLDALVAQGINQVSGPDLAIDKPEAALDEARTQAIATARARADLYARAAGMRVARIVSIDETGGYSPPEAPRPMMMAMARAKADTQIAPGEEKIGVTVRVTFELQ